MKKIFVSILLISIFSVNTKAQDYSKVNGGFGLGLDYGGQIGTKVTYLPVKWFGLFGSVGLYYYSTGYTIGVQFKFPSEKKVSGHLTGMYGVNAGLESEVLITRNRYYGPSIGGGIELKNKRFKNTFWNFELLIPFRDAQLQKDVDTLESQGLTVNSSTWPVNFSIGLHVMLQRGDFKNAFKNKSKGQ